MIDRHETLEEIVAVGWMSDFHPFNKDLVADPSPKILVIVDSCVEIKISRRVLLDGVAMPVPHRSTESFPHRSIGNKNTATSGEYA